MNGGPGTDNCIKDATEHSVTGGRGVYDVGGADTPLQMKPWVDVEGSGEGVTTLTASGSSSPFTGTAVGAANSELRFLTVNNTGGSDYASAIAVGGGPFELTHLTATASGGNNTGIGVQVCCGASVVLNEVNADASGNTRNVGVSVVSNSSVTSNETNVSASGGIFDRGIENDSGTVEVANSRISSSGFPIRNLTTTRVAASQLYGPPVLNQGSTLDCAGVYDENYAFFADSCP